MNPTIHCATVAFLDVTRRRMNFLSRPRNVVIFLCGRGMPGVGKSVIVGAIYYKPRTSDNFKKHAWVNVCHSFNPTDFSRSLLLDLHSESTSVEEIYSKTLKTDDHIKECQLLLHEYKCLIVIDGLHSRKKTDGLQSKEDWNWIKSNLIKYGDSGSCIITITCEECVAKHCADQRVAPPLDQPSFPPRNTIFATLE